MNNNQTITEIKYFSDIELKILKTLNRSELKKYFKNINLLLFDRMQNFKLNINLFDIRFSYYLCNKNGYIDPEIDKKINLNLLIDVIESDLLLDYTIAVCILLSQVEE